MRTVNPRRLLTVALTFVGGLQVVYWLMAWAAGYAHCGEWAHGGCSQLPQWQSAVRLMLPLAHMLIIAILARHSLRELRRKPKRMNAAIWGLLGLDIFSAALCLLVKTLQT